MILNALIEIWRDLRSNRMRTFLSALSVFMTVISVVAIVSAAAIARDVFVAQEEQLDGRAVTMAADLPQGDLSPDEFARLLGDFRTRVTAHGGAFAVLAPLLARVGSRRDVEIGGGSQRQLTAVAGQLTDVRRLPIVRGRWLRPDSEPYPLEAVVNPAGAVAMGDVGTVLGLQVSGESEPFSARIVGVVSDGHDEPSVYVSLPGLLVGDVALLDDGPSLQVLVHRRATDAGILQAMLRKSLTDSGFETSQIDVVRADKVAQLAARLRDLRRGFLVSAAVSMVVALLGLLNIGLASVRERSRELVVRRAIGASRPRLFVLVLATALAAALVACVAAFVLAGIAIYAVLPAYVPRGSALVLPGFPWQAAFAGLGVGVLTAAAGAGYPATVAARVDVATALRD